MNLFNREVEKKHTYFNALTNSLISWQCEILTGCQDGQTPHNRSGLINLGIFSFMIQRYLHRETQFFPFKRLLSIFMDMSRKNAQYSLHFSRLFDVLLREAVSKYIIKRYLVYISLDFKFLSRIFNLSLIPHYNKKK